MTTIFKYLSLTILTALLSIEGVAQTSSSLARSGSLYSFYGIGYPTDFIGVEEQMVGSVGASFRGISSTGFGNPALWAQTVFTNASAGFSFEQFNASDKNATSTNALITPTNLQLTFPLIQNKLGFAAGIYPVTRSRFRFFDGGEILPESSNETDTLSFVVDQQGTGGINKLEFGLGYRLTSNISVGYAASYVFVSNETESSITFPQGGADPQFQTVGLDGQGFGNRFGIMASTTDLFSKGNILSLGVTATLPVNLESDREIEFEKDIGNQLETVVISDGENLGNGDVSLPWEFTGGLTYYFGQLANLSFETQYQGWDAADFDFSSEQETFLKDRYKFGLGGQYHPYRTRSNSFFANFKYSAGVSYDTGHLKINGQNIETLLFSVGLGILSPRRSRSTIDLGLQYGVRGTKSSGLVKEEIWAFKISVNLAELMFIRPKLQ